MQELQRRQQDEKRLREVMGQKVEEKPLEERIGRLRHLQYFEGQQIFAQQYSTVHKAASDGNIFGVNFFFSLPARRRASVKDMDGLGRCPVHYAAENGHVHIVKYLMEKKCPVDLPASDGATPMMLACKENRLDTIRYLFEKRASLTVLNISKFTALHYACVGDHVDALELCLSLFVEETEQLIAAATAEQSQKGKSSKMSQKALPPLPTSSVPSTNDGKKISPVPASVETGGLNAMMSNVRSLFKSTAPPSIPTKPSEGVEGVEGGDEATVGSAVTYQSTTSSVRRAQNDNVLNSQKSVLLEVRTASGERPLHVAAFHDSQRCLRFLIDQGANIHAVDDLGETALHKAARRNNYGAYRILKEAGCKENQMNRLKETPQRLFVNDSFVG